MNCFLGIYELEETGRANWEKSGIRLDLVIPVLAKAGTNLENPAPQQPQLKFIKEGDVSLIRRVHTSNILTQKDQFYISSSDGQTLGHTVLNHSIQLFQNQYIYALTLTTYNCVLLQSQWLTMFSMRKTKFFTQNLGRLNHLRITRLFLCISLILQSQIFYRLLMVKQRDWQQHQLFYSLAGTASNN
ncbi:Hypothetical_protein [Hexamita inflata]|uniref:Hypothetical_protein n=1 Tax=Hexamita inflata TaxID=28002 RepID=A0AA86UGM1_9EUKA|nr:Hypothetical protein HINF_LOCUS42704 [Hexamita inflata]